MLAAETEPLDQIVDVGEMVIDFAAAQDRKPSSRHSAKQLQQPAIAGPVDAARTDDRDFDAQALTGFACKSLAFELRELVDIARSEGRLLVGGGMLHVSMHPHCAAVH